MVHEGQDAQAHPVRDDRLGQTAESQSVDQHPRAVVESRQDAEETRAGRGVRVRKGPLQAVHVHTPATAAQPFRHPGVVDVAAGLLVERPGDDQMQPACAHGRPS